MGPTDSRESIEDLGLYAAGAWVGTPNTVIICRILAIGTYAPQVSNTALRDQGVAAQGFCRQSLENEGRRRDETRKQASRGVENLAADQVAFNSMIDHAFGRG